MPKPRKVLPWLFLWVIIALGLWARWRYIEAGVYQIDEFISMLSIKMILEKGVPVFPSGLYYDHGLVYSYLGAASAAIFGGNLLAARWWSMLAGGLTIAVTYIAARQMFRTEWWGLVGALGVALDPNLIQWGGRARMYSQANLVLILWIWLAWKGTLGGGQRWARWLFIGLIWVGLSTHIVMLLALPPLIVALLLTWLLQTDFQPRRSKLSPGVIVESLVALVIVAGTIWSNAHGFVASYTVDSSVPASEAEVVNDDATGDVLDFGWQPYRWGEMQHHLESLLPFAVLAGLGLAAAGIAIVRGQRQADGLAGFMVGVMLVSTMVGMLLFVADTWHESRYYQLAITLPVLLLASYGGKAIFVTGYSLLEKLQLPKRRAKELVAAIPAVILGFLWPVSVLAHDLPDIGHTDTPNQYDQAFEYINAVRTPADQVATVRPEAAYLFSTRLDYYVNHTSPVLIPGDKGLVDGYTGTPFLANVSDLQAALEQPGSLWVVTDKQRLFTRLEPIFVHYLYQQMEHVHSVGNVFLFREKDDFAPLPLEAGLAPLATFYNGIQLVDFRFDGQPQPGSPVRLTTYWQNTGPLWLLKVFVHVRDQAGNMIATADFAPMDQVVPELREYMAGKHSGDMVALQTTIQIPGNLPSGGYGVMLGVYEPNTLQRLPLFDDVSGENAFVITSTVKHQ